MGKHATTGNGLTGHKNTTLKQASKASMMARVYAAARNPFPVKTETFEPLPALEFVMPEAFKGINPVYGQDFTQTGNNAYKLRVREGFVGLRRVTIKPKDGKAYGVWVASYAGQQMPLVSNKGQALGFAESKDKLFQLLVIGSQATRPAHIIPADPKVKAPKAYYGGEVSRFVIYAVKGDRKIRYTVPEGKTSGEIVDDMLDKGYEIVRIANS